MTEKSELILNVLISSKPLEVVMKYLKNKDLVGISLLFDKQFYDILRGKLLELFYELQGACNAFIKVLEEISASSKKRKGR
jgi:hypothetical protein